MNYATVANVWTGHDPSTGLYYLLTAFTDGSMELATREQPSHTWGPPVALSGQQVTGGAA